MGQLRLKAFIAGAMLSVLAAGCSAAIGLDDLSFDLDTSDTTTQTTTDTQGTDTDDPTSTEGTGDDPTAPDGTDDPTAPDGTDDPTAPTDTATDTSSQDTDTGTANDCVGDIIFDDPDLEHAVRTAINAAQPTTPLSDTDPIPAAAALLVDELWAGNQGISDLTGLECLKNLERLMLHFNQVTDLWPLTGLKYLRDLYLEGNKLFSDVTPLQGVSSLRTLQVTGTHVQDFSALAGLGLTTVEANGITGLDLGTLPPLPNLQGLQLMDNGLGSFEHLTASHYPSLITLAVSGNSVSSWSFLAGLPGLTGLWAMNTGLVSLDPFIGLTELEELDVSRNGLTTADLQNGPVFEVLRDLWLAENTIANTDWVATKTPDLRLLSLTGNKVIPHLAGLADATTLTYLIVSDISGLTTLDIIPTSTLNRLLMLDTSQNSGLTDIGALSNASKLTNLDAYECDIVDIAALSGLSNLQEINVGNNRIVNLVPLGNTPKITYMGLTHNLISDITPLVTNPGIGAGDTVNLDGNPVDCSDSAALNVKALSDRGVSLDITCP